MTHRLAFHWYYAFCFRHFWQLSDQQTNTHTNSNQMWWRRHETLNEWVGEEKDFHCSKKKMFIFWKLGVLRCIFLSPKYPELPKILFTSLFFINALKYHKNTSDTLMLRIWVSENTESHSFFFFHCFVFVFVFFQWIHQQGTGHTFPNNPIAGEKSCQVSTNTCKQKSLPCLVFLSRGPDNMLCHVLKAVMSDCSSVEIIRLYRWANTVSMTFERCSIWTQRKNFRRTSKNNQGQKKYDVYG